MTTKSKPIPNANLWKQAAEELSKIDVQRYLNIDEQELKIYETPEDTLFNKEVIDKNADIIDIPKNMKRDYSFATYKDQLADLQLRKELAEKNRKAGILTAKQKKAVEDELQIEKKIRDQLKKLHDSFEEKIKLLFMACKKEPQFAAENIKFFYDVLIPLTKSPLVAKIAVRGYLSYRDAIFKATSDDLHKLIAQASLRALDSKFLMDHWCETPLDEQIRQSFHLLSSACFLYAHLLEDEEDGDENEKSEQNEENEDESIVTINAAKLAFLLPFFEQVFKVNPERYDVELRIRVAKFLKDAMTSKFIKPDELYTLPMLKLGSLLFHLLCLDTSIEYIEIIQLTLTQFLDMLNQNTSAIKMDDVELEKFIDTCFFYTKDKDAIKRINVFKEITCIDVLLDCMIKEKKNVFESVRHTLFLARYDPDPVCAELVEQLWKKLRLPVSEYDCNEFLPNLHDDLALIREEAAKVIQSLASTYPDKSSEILTNLDKLYKQLSKFEPAQYDTVGRKIRDEIDPWEKRVGITKAILLLAEGIKSEKYVMPILHLVVPEGLNDRAEACRNNMRNAATIVIQNYGETMVDQLFPFIEGELNKLTTAAKDDNLRQGLIVLIGTLAQYLKEDDKKIRIIVARLIEALSTPSQQVQESVAGCLPALVPFLRTDAKTLAENMFNLLTNAESYGERRGAAYGIASIIKGLGVASIKEMNINARLKELLAQKQKPLHREGALLCIEMLCSTIGKLFEPYLVHLLPDLLNAFSDSSEAVRRTADDTARAMMRSLSAHGVKLLLPSLLKGLDDDSWRTKYASVDLLGAMSNCAPRQLSTSLPSIVPKLCDALTDTQSKVQKASERALKQIAQVIQNPECLAISQHLIQALVDPPGKTASCLQTIVNNKFVHYIDSPSLALMMPIIYRALADRNTEARRMAAQIIANIYSLVDHKDMEPYLAALVPGLKKALLDPVPEVRTVAAKAIGSIIQFSAPATSENIQSDVMPWLKENLVSETSSVDRQGAAQGLSEVIAAMGDVFLEQNLPGVIRITESPTIEPYIRDGYILLYIYLPIALGERFVPYIGKIIPSILKALADETEYVRDSALRAGKRLITTYSNHARKLLLPQLQAALIHENWRIRQASVKLIGDFLFNISGVSGKMTSETAGEDDTMGSEAVNKAIVRCIGQRPRDELMAGIYLARYDVALVVRQAASHVWKVVVANTPRTLRDMMKPLFELLLHCLSSPNEDQQQMAVRCLSELVKKMGERILTVILPILEDRLANGGVDDRRGVAFALNEIIENTHREIIENHSASFVNAIRTCLCDNNKSVRDAANQTFSAFHGMTGSFAIDQIVSPMLDDFNKTGEIYILDGLCAIISGPSSRQLFQNLLPKLSRSPVNSIALCRIAAASGAISRNLPKLMDALLSEQLNTTVEEHIQNCLPVLFSIDDEEDVRTMLTSLLRHATGNRNALTAITLLKEYIENNEDEFTDSQLDLLVSGFISLYNCSNSDVLACVIDCFSTLIKMLEPPEYIELVLVLKRALKGLYTDSKKLADGQSVAFCQPKGWQPIVAVLREGMLAGGVEIKEVSANCIAQAIQMSNDVGIKPHVVNIAGPLIRVLGEKHPSPVKIAAMNALIKLLDKMPLSLKPFLPQMQSVFLKILQDPASQNLRQLSAQGVGHLLSFHPKPDSLLKELNKLCETEEISSSPEIAFDLKTDKIVQELIARVKEKI